MIKHPEKAEEIYNKVKVRGPAQGAFRSALLKAYDHECAICGLSFVEALEAAHILPWSKTSHSERISPRNGLLLYANHQKLFDAGWIKINIDLKIMHVDENNYYRDADRAATIEFDCKTLTLPKDKNLWPALELVRKRYIKKDA